MRRRTLLRISKILPVSNLYWGMYKPKVVLKKYQHFISFLGVGFYGSFQLDSRCINE